MAASRKRLALMGKAPYYAEAFSPITGRCFRLVSRQDGQAGHAGFCSRSPAEPLAAL